jgi:hypothetical protein
MERRTLGLIALVGSLVACFPTACCFGFYAFGNFMALTVDPKFIEGAAGTGGEVPPSSTFIAMGGGSAIGALIALGLGIAILIWGIRALRARAEGGEPTPL